MSDRNPTQAEPTPPFPEQEQEPLGTEAEMRALAQELADRGIRVDAVAPGDLDTAVVMSFPADKNAQFGADTPLGRPGQPGELAPRLDRCWPPDERDLLRRRCAGRPDRLRRPARGRRGRRRASATHRSR